MSGYLLLRNVTVVAALAFPGPASSLPNAREHTIAQFPTTVEEAMALYEGEVRDWADGPVNLIILEEEEDIWDDLDNDEQRRRFIAWFWDRRDNELRDDEHPARSAFYAGVAEANKRFTEIPRGWRTDRGRVWVMFGQPTVIRSDMDDENLQWNYFSPGLQRLLAFNNAAGEFDVYFWREQPRGYRITGGVAPGAWPAYVQRVMEFVRRAMIQDPDLEFQPGQ